MLDDVKEVAEAVLRDTSEAMDVDDEDSKGAGSTGALLVANAVEAVYRASRLGRIEGAQGELLRSWHLTNKGEVSADVASTPSSLDTESRLRPTRL